MSKDHQSVLLDDKVLIRKTFVQLVTVLIDDVVERYSNISKGDHDITADISIL